MAGIVFLSSVGRLAAAFHPASASRLAFASRLSSGGRLASASASSSLTVRYLTTSPSAPILPK